MKKVLVANRGEIALRIFKSCRALGLSTVAIYSEADATAAHVRAADEARLVGPPRAQDSYLKVENVLAAARDADVDAIHPGYGFLSENAEFAQAVISSGLTWVGPAPGTMRQLGDKERARELAETSNVPVLPGSRRFESGQLDGSSGEADRVGYPLLVKATAGGGGIGMRRVDAADQLGSSIAATQSMAEKSFGSGSIYMERFIPKARHIEIQIFGFGDGNAIHLFERDCSLQRQFQKVIEESPAPSLPEEVRRHMAQAALRLACSTQYAGAGTVEFVVDAETFEFFFLEMNTRIQVEHAVTEMVTSTDIVSMQLELAAGTLKRAQQVAIQTRGCALECRLYAENPAKMFMPSPGTLKVFAPPAGRPHLRIDSGYEEGDVVTPFYDPMIAKVIAWGESRDDVRHRAADALRAFQIEGIRTNREFLIACLDDAEFAAGNVYTGFIDARRTTLIAG